MTEQRGPGLGEQAQARTTMRVLGGVLVLGGLVLTVIGVASFASSFNDDSGVFLSSGPSGTFFLAFLGLPMMGVGGWLLRAGFLGTASRYVAGETAPVLKDTLAYLGDGGQPAAAVDPRSATAAPGPFCRACGVRNDSTARFCDGCGQPLS